MPKTPTTTTTYAITGQMGQPGTVGTVGTVGSMGTCTTSYSSTSFYTTANIGLSGSTYNFYVPPVEIRFGFTLKFKSDKAKLVRILNEGQKLSFEPTHDLKQIL